MTIRKSLVAALGTVAVAGLWLPQTGHAAVSITVPRPAISIPRVTIPAVKPAVPAVKAPVSTYKPSPGPKPPISAKLATEEAQRKEIATLNKDIAADKKNIAAETTKVAADEKTIKSEEQTLIGDLNKGDMKAAQSELNVVEKAVVGLRSDQTALRKDQTKLGAAESMLKVLETQVKAAPTGTASAPTNASTIPANWMPSGAYVLPANHVALPPNAVSSLTAVLDGKPVIKITYVNGNGTTLYYLSQDAQHIVGVVSSISAPATHTPPQNVATTQPVASHPATQPSGQSVTYTPVKYPEITNAYGSPIGYINAQGQSVYFPNGQMPVGFVVGPNHTIETYVSSTSTPIPVSKPNPAPAPAPQPPAPSKPAPSSGHKVTFTPVSYPEIVDAYGAPMGYVNAQGQAVYFNNGQLPQGFTVGPNQTIQTYVKS